MYVDVVDAEHGEGVVGDRCQVPGQQDPPGYHPATPGQQDLPGSHPATPKCPVDHQLHISYPVPVQSLHLLFMVMYVAMETNPEPLKSRFDMHLRIPADIEKKLDKVQNMVVNAEPCQVSNPHASLTKDDVICALLLIGAVMEVSGKLASLHTVPVVHVGDLEAGDVVGDGYQVPGKRDPSVSGLISGKMPAQEQPYPSVSTTPEAFHSLYYSAMSEHASVDTKPCVMDNFASSSSMDPFALVESSNYSVSQWSWSCLVTELHQFDFGSVLHGQRNEDSGITFSHLRAFPWPGECIAFMQPLKLYFKIVFCASKDR